MSDFMAMQSTADQEFMPGFHLQKLQFCISIEEERTHFKERVSHFAQCFSSKYWSLQWLPSQFLESRPPLTLIQIMPSNTFEKMKGVKILLATDKIRCYHHRSTQYSQIRTDLSTGSLLISAQHLVGCCLSQFRDIVRYICNTQKIIFALVNFLCSLAQYYERQLNFIHRLEKSIQLNAQKTY